MQLQKPINVNSIRIVKEQLEGLIQSLQVSFEEYVIELNDISKLDFCAESTEQLASILGLLECKAGENFAREMTLLSNYIKNDNPTEITRSITEYTQALFILPRYIDYIVSSHTDMPVLLSEYVNNMRIARLEKPFTEADTLNLELPELVAINTDAEPSIDQLASAIKRLHLMFQVALVKVFKRQQIEPVVGQLLSRPVNTVYDHLKGSAVESQWSLANNFVESIVGGDLTLNLNRKRGLAAIERMLNSIYKDAKASGELNFPTEAINNMLCGVLLAANDEVSQQYGLPKVDWSDSQIQALRNKMLGPNQDTINSVSVVLVEELRHVKDVLEIAAQKDDISADEASELKSKLLQVTDTLLMINLKSLSETSRELTNKIGSWGGNTSHTEFAEAADSVLFLDSSIQSLLRNEKTVDELNDLSLQGREEILNRNQFAEAELLVLREAESNIALAKRAITSYVDSNFDMAHIANVSVTLSTVKGGLTILNRDRAASIIDKTCAFIQSHIDDTSQDNEERFKLIEILADALISLEYYIDQLLNTGKADDKILEIAEQSIAELGFKVK